MRRQIRKTKQDYVVDVVVHVLLVLTIIATLYPFYFVLIRSFNEGNASSSTYFWPARFTFDNYVSFFEDGKWSGALVVSVIRTLVGTVTGVIFTCIVAYALSFNHLLHRKVYMTLLIISMYFSGGIIPYYMLLKSLHLFDSFLVYIIPTALSVFFIMVGISFFKEIPSDLYDSARVDGANDATIFFRLVLPVSKPFLATIALFVGVNHWNAWFDSAFFVSDQTLKTLASIMMEVISRNTAGYMTAQTAAARANATTTTFSIQTAAMIVSVAPIICVYPFLQRYFVKGMMIGSVKG